MSPNIVKIGRQTDIYSKDRGHNCGFSLNLLVIKHFGITDQLPWKDQAPKAKQYT